MENQPKLNNSKEIIAYLAEKFPLCFIVEGEAKPLKIGIFQELAARLQHESLISKTQLRTALRLYTSSWRYLYGVRVGAERVDLDGQLCGVIDEEHVIHARQQLDEAKAKVKAARVAEQVKKNEKRPKTNKVPPIKNKSPERVVSTKKEKEPIKKTAIKSTELADLASLKVDQKVKVLIGKNAMDAVILEIIKDGARVQLPSGLAMTVRVEHLAI